MRGLAILLVLPHNLRQIHDASSGAALLWVQLADRGWIGVQLFFVLSGFLITRILLSAQTAANYYSGFYARRALRIMPLYYATLLLWLVILPWFGWAVRHDTQYDIWLWVFLSNWVQPFHPSGSGLAHFWSLAVEEQFYLFWPLALRRLTPRGVWRLCGLVAMASLVLRAAMLATGWPTEAVYEFTPCRMDALALGGAVAAVLEMPELMARIAPWVRWSPALLFVAGAVVSRGYRQTGVLAQTWGYTLLAAAVAAWILSIAVASGREHSWLRSRVMRLAGKYSYGLYVIHFLIGPAWLRVLAAAGWHPSAVADVLQVLAASTVVFLLAWLCYHGLEHPFLCMKSRFEPKFAPRGY